MLLDDSLRVRDQVHVVTDVLVRQRLIGVDAIMQAALEGELEVVEVEVGVVDLIIFLAVVEV